MQVAVVTVGDEILAGDTVNTNASWLCARLAERGVDVERVITLPDRVADIARVVNEYHAEYDAVLVTGGLGPTHDDLTMAAVAAAFGRDLEPHDEALDWLTEHGGYSASDLAAGTTDLPAGARFLPNTEGVAPGCVVESVYVLPGVPDEMEAMFAAIETEFSGEPRYVRTLLADEPESALLDRIEGVREAFDVRVGSYPGEGVRLKLTGTDESEVESAVAWLRERVDVATQSE
ncbi:competence/damage-inducible protein A [Halobium salinum]|uniref:Competence/damage-inducible protein A n=1 Tax=Halobium salinum TaxID=1364940 RepID=A0ABD5PGZ0_9EURY|nr:molybdopterin-binding protein [Halobium salinum]